MRNHRRSLLGAVAAVGMVAAACGGDGGAVPTSADGAGQVTITGSSTVEPISARVAEKFNRDNPDVAISVDGPGTGDGFEIFCSGGADITDASRPIKEEEAQACAEAGIEFIELKVAIDGLSVITSTRNDLVGCLSLPDLYALLGPESTGFQSWSDAQALANELGSDTDFPDAPLVVTAPGEESGTYDSFVEIAFADIAEERGQAEESRPDYQSSPNDNVIIEGISGTETSLGWVGYAFVKGNEDTIKPLPVDGGDGCVEPTEASISSGEFPLARPLFIYVDRAKAESNQAVADYVDLYMSDEGFASVGEVGYVDLPEQDRQATQDAWENRETGTREG